MSGGGDIGDLPVIRMYHLRRYKMVGSVLSQIFLLQILGSQERDVGQAIPRFHVRSALSPL